MEERTGSQTPPPRNGRSGAQESREDQVWFPVAHGDSQQPMTLPQGRFWSSLGTKHTHGTLTYIQAKAISPTILFKRASY